MLAWLSVWSEVQTCICPSWCHCHSLSLASVKSRLVLPFWYRLTWVFPEKGPLNGCVYGPIDKSCLFFNQKHYSKSRPKVGSSLSMITQLVSNGQPAICIGRLATGATCDKTQLLRVISRYFGFLRTVHSETLNRRSKAALNYFSQCLYTGSCFRKIQIGFTFLVPAHPGSPGQRAVKRVCVCACLYTEKST